MQGMKPSDSRWTWSLKEWQLCCLRADCTEHWRIQSCLTWAKSPLLFPFLCPAAFYFWWTLLLCSACFLVGGEKLGRITPVTCPVSESFAAEGTSREGGFRPWKLLSYSPPKLWKLLRSSAVLPCGFLRDVKDSPLGRQTVSALWREKEKRKKNLYKIWISLKQL